MKTVFFVLFSVVLGMPVSATTSCDLLIAASPKSFSIGKRKAGVFAVEIFGELYVLKGWDVETLPEDLELADFIFRESGSKLFKANLVLDNITIPSKDVPIDLVPERTLNNYTDDFYNGTVEMHRSRFVYGEVPYKTIHDIPVNERKRVLENNRIFHAEGERIVNWIRTNSVRFHGVPVRSSIDVDFMHFRPAHRQKRQDSLLRKSYVFTAGENQFSISYGENIVIEKGKFVLVDPH